MPLNCFMLFTFELSFRYTVVSSYDCKKVLLESIEAVSEAYTKADKNIFASSKIYFEWNWFFMVTIPLKFIGSSMKRTETVST